MCGGVCVCSCLSYVCCFSILFSLLRAIRRLQKVENLNQLILIATENFNIRCIGNLCFRCWAADDANMYMFRSRPHRVARCWPTCDCTADGQLLKDIMMLLLSRNFICFFCPSKLRVLQCECCETQEDNDFTALHAPAASNENYREKNKAAHSVCRRNVEGGQCFVECQWTNLLARARKIYDQWNCSGTISSRRTPKSNVNRWKIGKVNNQMRMKWNMRKMQNSSAPEILVWARVRTTSHNIWSQCTRCRPACVRSMFAQLARLN